MLGIAYIACMSDMIFSGGNSGALEALLDFYIEAGVDCAIDELPRDRFKDSVKVPPAPATTLPPAASSRQTIMAAVNGTGAQPLAIETVDETARTARQLAQGADTLDALHAALISFDGCALKTTAKNLVFSDGNPKARVMLVGEAPGRDEDIQGKPFVGRSGHLLDRMLKAIGLNRATDTYIANIVPWRPPGNRTPTPQETAACFPFIQRQIELCDPDILVCLGGPSVQVLLGVKEGILRTRGRWFKYNTGKREIRALATLHPAYLLRQPLQKRLAWRDLCALKKALAESAQNKEEKT